MTALQLTLIYLCAVSIITLAFFAGDKRRARAKEYRIPERVLIGLCFLGGAAGGLTGMLLCHHKTKKAKFIILVPLALVFNAAIAVCVAIYLK